MKKISILTKKLNKKNIKQICEIKNIHWKYGLKSQMNFFKKNIKNNDIHNMIFMDNKLIAYTALRNSNLIFNKIKIKYLRFDTLVIDKNYRGKGIAKIIMILNNKIIKLKKKPALLTCKRNMIQFYSKYSWRTIKKNKIKVKNYKNKNFMIFNKNFRSNSIFYLNDF